MLKPCPECGNEISDRASSCPKCGHPLVVTNAPAAAVPPAAPMQPKKRAPVFVVLAVGTFAFLLLIPRIFLVLQLAGVVVTLFWVLIAVLRREKGRVLAAVVGVLAVGAYVLSGADLQRNLAAMDAPSAAGGTGSSYEDYRKKNEAALSQAELVKMTWVKDREFGTSGTIKWNVQVKNNGQAYMRDAKVEFTTYDKQGSMVSTTFTYVQAIPPGGTRAESSFANLYGTEARASAKVVSVTLE